MAVPPEPLSLTEAQLAEATVAVYVARDVVSVSGPDAVTYLQGQLTQDVAALAAGAAAWSLLLEPNGKVVAWLRVLRAGEETIQLDVDAGAGAAVEQRLRRFLLRTRAEVGLQPDQPMLAVRGIPAEAFETGGGTLPWLPGSGRNGPGVPPAGPRLPIVWPGVDGVDVLVPELPAETLAGVRAHGYAQASYDRLRIEAGVPAMGAELTPDTIPGEAGQWLIDASVSFTKGCYTGQELVARVDSRGGNVPRPVRRLVVEGPAKVGDPVVPIGAGTAAGLITSAAWVEDRQVTVALAPLARKVEVGATVMVGAASATVLPPPESTLTAPPPGPMRPSKLGFR
jgi:tRNA-modifying protein YgfZ